MDASSAPTSRITRKKTAHALNSFSRRHLVPAVKQCRFYIIWTSSINIPYPEGRYEEY